MRPAQGKIVFLSTNVFFLGFSCVGSRKGALSTICILLGKLYLFSLGMLLWNQMVDLWALDLSYFLTFFTELFINLIFICVVIGSSLATFCCQRFVPSIVFFFGTAYRYATESFSLLDSPGKSYRIVLNPLSPNNRNSGFFSLPSRLKNESALGMS